MNCAQARQEFSAMLDGELAPEVRDDVEAHLSECAGCRRELEKLKRLDGLYRALPPQQAPDRFEEGVRASLNPVVVQFRRRERPFAARRVWPLLAAAAAMLVILGGVLFQLEKQPQNIKLASGPKETLHPEAQPSPAGAKQEAQALPGKTGKELKSPARPPSAKGRAALDSDEWAEGVRDITQAPRNMPQKTLERGAVEQNQKDFTAVFAPQKIEEKERSKINAGGVPPKETAKADQSAAKAPPPTAAPPPAARVAAEAQALAEPEAMKPPSPPTEEVPDGLEAASDKAAWAPEKHPPVEAKQKAVSVDTLTAAEAEAPQKVEAPKPPLPEPSAPMFRRQITGVSRPHERFYTPEPGIGHAEKKERVLREKRRIAGHTFELHEDVWIENRYAGEATIRLYRGSALLRQLTKRRPRLSKIAALGDRVIFRIEEKWCQIEPAPSDEPQK